VLEHDDQAGVADRREAVGDDDRGAAGEQAAQALLDAVLGVDVDVGGRLVEDQDPGIGDQRAGSWRWPADSCAPRSPTSVS
jgi:hypothetical protein